MEERTYSCPGCGYALTAETTDCGRIYACHQCQGKMVSLYVLKRHVQNEDIIRRIWKDIVEPLSGARICCFCGKSMSIAALPEMGCDMEVCKSCQMVWFDKGELEKLPAPPKLVQNDQKQLAEQYFITYLVEHPEEAQPKETTISIPSNITGLQYAMGLAGLPLEEDHYFKDRDQTRKPWLTWILSGIMVLIFLLSLSNLRSTIHTWGFKPSEWYSAGGLTILSSMLLHSGFWHILGNLYFFIVFGDNVEKHLGGVKYTVVFIMSHFCGLLLHFLIYMDSSIPLVGASAAISGILAYYTIMFPKNRITVVLLRIPVKLPVLACFVLWIINNLVMLASQPNVAVMAHLGGALFGLCYAVGMKRVTNTAGAPGLPVRSSD